jgi:hypothetical protein
MNISVKADDAGDHHDERQGAQIRKILAEQVGIDQITRAGGQGQHESGGRAHADGGFQLARNPHEWAQPENLRHHDVVHEHRADKNE